MNRGHGMRARAFDRWEFNEVGVAVQIEVVGGEARYVDWDQPHRAVVSIDEREALPEQATLRLPADVALAVYEALSEHFGYTGQGGQALRKDYDAERARVDKLIANLIDGRA